MQLTNYDPDPDLLTQTRSAGPIVGAALALIAAAAVGLGCAPEPEAEAELRADLLIDAIDEAPALAVAALQAPLPDLDPGVCTLEARPAALIGVVDQGGGELTGVDDGVTVMFVHKQADGSWSEPEEGLCIDADCSRWAIGYAQPGEYIIGAFACAGAYELGRFEVGRTADGCHVDTVTTRLQLELAPACMSVDDELDGEPLTCGTSLPAKPSVIAMTGVIVGDMVIPQPPSELTLEQPGADTPKPMSCVDPSCTLYASASYGLPGEFELDAQLCGEQISRELTVEPTPDGCNVQTEWVGVFSDAERCVVFDYDVE